MPMQPGLTRQDAGALKREHLFLIILAILLVALIWCLTCYKGGGGPPISGRAYSALPSGCPPDSAPGDTTQLNACLQGLTFDTVPAIGDEQRLMIRDSLPGPFCHGDTTHSCRYGPLAKIEPVIGAHEYTDGALLEGRIIARMFIRPAETDSYPKLGLVLNDTTYWYVNTTLDSSYLVSRPSSGAQLATTVRQLEVDPHPDRFQQAVARWVWDDTDEKTQGTCGQACCR
jgi:hypothetical protein